MNTTQRNNILSPVTGLTIYNTLTNCIEFYNGTAWQASACKCASAPYAGISGPTKVGYNQTGITYTANYDPSYTYTWTVNGYATIASGAGTNTITVNTTGGGTLGVSRSFTVALTISNYCGTSAATPIIVSSGGKFDPKGNGGLGFSTTLTDNVFYTDGINKITLKAWGAGGGGSDNGQGGGGGYAGGEFSVTPGTFLTLVVGERGVYNSPGTGYGVGGGAGATIGTGTASGSGGGYTGVFTSSTPSQASALIIAGGGGGAGRGGTDCSGGAGGGTSGVSGNNVGGGNGGGKGGTSSAGGAGGIGTDATCGTVSGEGGTALQGGRGGGSTCYGYTGAGGGGGGGYWGGGGGSSRQGSGTWYPGGGGGSGYYDATKCTSVCGLTAGSGQNPGNNGDSELNSGSASGGNKVTAGGHGWLIIKW